MQVGNSGSVDNPGQSFADDVRVADSLDHEVDDNDELGVDETDELVGQLVDYVSDLTLLPRATRNVYRNP